MGTKPQYKTEAAVALNVIDGTKTFLPFGNELHNKAKCKAAVPELTPTANFVPINFAKFFSNCFTSGPYPSQALLKLFEYFLTPLCQQRV